MRLTLPRNVAALMALAVLVVGCEDRSRPAERAPSPATRPSTQRAPNSTVHFLPGQFEASDADIARGPAAPTQVRRAVETYYRERNWSTYVMPPRIRAVKTVGEYELLWVEAVKSLDRELVYDRRSGRVVGSFNGGHLPGDAVQSPATARSRAATRP